MEIKWIPGFEGRYLATDDGKIISLFRQGRLNPKIMKTSKTPTSIYVGLLVGDFKKVFSVARLVAMAFVKKPKGTTEIIHLDYNNDNNKAKNLKWVTRQGRIQHTHSGGLKKTKKLTSKQLDEKFYALHGRPETWGINK